MNSKTPAFGDLRARLAGTVKLGDLRVLAKDIGRNQELANKLWQAGSRNERLLAVLILDPKTLTPEAVDTYLADAATHDKDDAIQIATWLLANQLMKLPKLFPHLAGWIDEGVGEVGGAAAPTSGAADARPALATSSAATISVKVLKRRLGWEWHARIMNKEVPGKADPEYLLRRLETEMEVAPEPVQWNMNYAAAQIGLTNKLLRPRCLELGERLGLYKDYPVPKGCTSPYLPIWITELASD